MLVRKLKGEENTLSISPALKIKSGALLWLVETDKRQCFFAFNEVGAVLVALNNERLGDLDASELRTAREFESSEASGAQ
jgi:hypothetical protein